MVRESWVSRDATEFTSDGLDADRQLLNDVVDYVLLNRNSE